MYLTIADAAAALRARQTSAVELTRHALKAAEDHDRQLGIYLSRFDESALAAARRADDELERGRDRGPLHGVPVGIKDTIPAREGRTTAQSRVVDRVRWDQTDSTVVARLRDAGAIIVGKTTTMEYAIGVPDSDQPFPFPRNPWNVDHWAGGSSSGTASGVSVGAFFGGLGTDGGGSVRTPASNCGITGLKPTFGRTPKRDCVPLGYSYIHVGPMARSAEDCASILAVIAGHDPTDPTSVDRPVADYSAGLAQDLGGLRIGLDMLVDRARHTAAELEAVLECAVTSLEDAGATIVPIQLPLYDELKTVTMNGMCCEAFASHRPDLQEQWAEYAPGTRAAIILGALVSSGDYIQMQKVRRVGQRKVADLFERMNLDVVVTPTNSAGAPRVDGLTLSGLTDGLHTAYWNSVGNPAMSVPGGFTGDGLPLGVQIVGKPFDESSVLQVGYAYQQHTDWHLRVPPMVSNLADA